MVKRSRRARKKKTTASLSARIARFVFLVLLLAVLIAFVRFYPVGELTLYQRAANWFAARLDRRPLGVQTPREQRGLEQLIEKVDKTSAPVDERR